ncbi:uncharacterized protein LOC141525754 [Cotesia typhae]|uniref:uncharacterized protein LOC141525754 n=1 Tax=Cotesia typhae TaxID=2053667 RepID=UPI003D68C5CC
MSERVKKFRAIKKIINKKKLKSRILFHMRIVNNVSHGDSDNNVNNSVNNKKTVDTSLNSENDYCIVHNNDVTDGNSSSSGIFVENDVEYENELKSEVMVTDEVEKNDDDFSENENVTLENGENSDRLQERLRQWALNNRANLQSNTISELLVLLREEGHPTLPKTAQTLLKTKPQQVVESIPSLKETDSDYKYLGVAEGLQKMILPKIFLEDTIEVLIHIDGIQVYKNSQMQLWPISVKVCNPNYTTHPFVAAIYGGDSKPANVKQYLSDFVKECKKLIKHGITIDKKKYAFRIVAIVADSQARSFIKCCKAAGTFYACERCTIKGKSVGKKRHKTRIYSEMDCELRTRESFNNHTQKEHHKEGLKSPLRKLPDFDPVGSVVLDSMHLLYQGVMKTIMESLILRTSVARLKIKKVIKLRKIFLKLTGSVPCEFQRKKFDTNDLARWKATQFRFVLLYCGRIVLKKILNKEMYQHFLLLFVGVRILHSKELMINFNSYARNLLRKFFYLLPSFYGEQSQTLICII